MSMSRGIDLRSIHEYLLMTLLIFVSGNPVISNRYVSALTGMIALASIVARGQVRQYRRLWRYLACYLVLFAAQKLVLGTIAYAGSLNMMLKIIFGATVMWKLGDRFRYAYFDVMTFLSAISLVFYFFQLSGYLIPEGIATGSDIRHSVLVYSYIVGFENRNCGPFWEPGAFACYLVLILLLFIDNLNNFVRLHPWKMLIIATALVTTFSTTGYLVSGVLIMLNLVFQSRHKLLVLITVVPLLTGSYYLAYSRLDFMGEKITYQNDRIELEEDLPEFNDSRMGSMVFDWYYIRKHPIVGNGMFEKTRFADHPELWGLQLGHGNGFSNFIAEMGILMFLIYIVLIYQNLVFDRTSRGIFLIGILLLLQGEQLLNYPIFLAMPFLVIDRKRSIPTGPRPVIRYRSLWAD